MEARAPINTLSLYARLLLKYAGWQLAVYALLTLLTSNAEGLGIALFLPLLSQGALGHDDLSNFVRKVVAVAHLSPTLTGVLPLVIGIFVLKGLLQFFTGAYQFKISSEISARMRRNMVNLLGRVDYRYLTERNTGTLTNLIANEVSRATSAFVSFSRILPLFVNIVAFFIIVAYLNVRLTALAACAGLAVLVLLRAPGRLTAKQSNITTRESAALSQLIIQTVHAMKYLRATRGFPRIELEIRGSIDRLAKAVQRIGVLYSLQASLSQPLVVIFLSLIILYYTSTGQPLAPLLVQLVYLYRIMLDVFALQSYWLEVSASLGGMVAVQETQLELETHAEPNGSQPFPGLSGDIALDKVDVSFGDKQVLRSISLTIPRHSTVALVGESGGGKTTLTDVISAVIRPDAGDVLFNGTSLSRFDIDQVRSRIGFVPQETVLFDDTIAANITLWSGAADDPVSKQRIERAARQAFCEDFILANSDGYSTLVGDRGIKLSGGQRQRLAIARELYREPEILILDEATSALDSESEAFIQRSIDGLKGQLTIIVIAHRLSTIRNADTIFVVKDGEIVESGSFTELLGRPDSRFRKMCEQQNLA